MTPTLWEQFIFKRIRVICLKVGSLRTIHVVKDSVVCLKVGSLRTIHVGKKSSCLLESRFILSLLHVVQVLKWHRHVKYYDIHIATCLTMCHRHGDILSATNLWWKLQQRQKATFPGHGFVLMFCTWFDFFGCIKSTSNCKWLSQGISASSNHLRKPLLGMTKS